MAYCWWLYRHQTLRSSVLLTVTNKLPDSCPALNADVAWYNVQRCLGMFSMTALHKEPGRAFTFCRRALLEGNEA